MDYYLKNASFSFQIKLNFVFFSILFMRPNFRVWTERRGYLADIIQAKVYETAIDIKTSIWKILKNNPQIAPEKLLKKVRNYKLFAELYDKNGFEGFRIIDDATTAEQLAGFFETSHSDYLKNERKLMEEYKFDKDIIDKSMAARYIDPVLFFIRNENCILYSNEMVPNGSLPYIYYLGTEKPSLDNYCIDEEKISAIEENQKMLIHQKGINQAFSRLLNEKVESQRIYEPNNTGYYYDEIMTITSVKDPIMFCRLLFIIFALFDKYDIGTGFFSHMFSHNFFEIDTPEMDGFFRVLQNHPIVLYNAIRATITFFGKGKIDCKNVFERSKKFSETLRITFEKMELNPDQSLLIPYNWNDFGEATKRLLEEQYQCLLSYDEKVRTIKNNYSKSFEFICQKNEDMPNELYSLDVSMGYQIENSFKVRFGKASDLGGPSNQFVTFCFQHIVSESENLFSKTLSGHYWFKYHPVGSNFEELKKKYCSIGIFLGMVMKSRIPISIRFPKCFYKLLRNNRLTNKDVFELIGKNSGEQNEFVIQKEIAPFLPYDYDIIRKTQYNTNNGLFSIGMDHPNNNMLLTKNVLMKEYLSFLFVESIKIEFEALIMGFRSTKPDKRLLQLLNPAELSDYVSGPEYFDYDNLLSTMCISNTSLKPLFQKVFNTLTDEEKRYFYCGITGIMAMPEGGFSSINKKHITINTFTDEKRSYIVHTCFWSVEINKDVNNQSDLLSVIQTIASEGKTQSCFNAL